jgi:hypothetical protein
LARQVGPFVACFPLNVLMVHSLKHSIVSVSINLTNFEFTQGEAIYIRSLEFITHRFDCMSFSPKENDSGPIFVGMVHSGSPSLYTILEESISEDD